MHYKYFSGFSVATLFCWLLKIENNFFLREIFTSDFVFAESFSFYLSLAISTFISPMHWEDFFTIHSLWIKLIQNVKLLSSNWLAVLKKFIKSLKFINMNKYSCTGWYCDKNHIYLNLIFIHIKYLSKNHYYIKKPKIRQAWQVKICFSI